ncbi:beta strand repeat-containing protein [Aquisediminimonas sediminicola]|uniref:beta strand repeat-containing protein n=1 Tax=Alteraquisediminimonas sediminicola TaxID=2676787 RepID=UPI001C8EC7D9|nr:MBG domain-containing protein [Aquisediminimonas sediminicola]
MTRMLFTTALIAPALVLSGQAAAQSFDAAIVLPQNGNIVAGSAVISSSASGGLNITQSTSKAVIDWSAFSIGENGSVHFDNGSGATLNRVTGSGVSSIDGLLSASGSVYLLNPNGVIIGKDGVVDVGGSFVASTLSLSNDAFMGGGDLTLAGSSTASVVNLGRIGALGGDIVLAAFHTVNQGAIAAPYGTAALLAGSTILLVDRGDSDGRFKVLIGGAGTNALNAGGVEAATVELRANGGSIYALAGDTRGVIKATGIGTNDGRIYLTAGTGGAIAVADSTLTARTSTGAGGMILIGSADTAQTSLIAGTVLDASALQGDGGFIETSAAHVTIADDVHISTLGAGARAGSWLIDPKDFTIAATGGDVTGATLSAQLATSNVEIQSANGATEGNGDIIVSDSVNWSANTTLTLTAERDIVINRDITATGASAGLVMAFGAGRDYQLNSGAITLSGDNASLNIDGNAYILIHNVDQLQAMASNLTGYYALGNGIDAAATAGWNGGAGFAPIGDNVNRFEGTLAGLGHGVNDLIINRPTQNYVGLFGWNSGAIRDIGMLGGSIRGNRYTGALVGVNTGTISNAYATGAVSGVEYVGGLVGLSGGTINNAHATGTVVATGNWVGGLVGVNYGTISKAYTRGAVSGLEFVGGLVGVNYRTISNVYATGAVNGTNYVGGLAGMSEGTINHAYATGSVSGTRIIGGLVGLGLSEISNVYATGAVSGNETVGGLFGNFSGTMLTNAYATGSVSASGAVGGLAGYNNGTMTNVYATGAVSGSGSVGGLIGTNDAGGSVTNAYATGAVTGVNTVGGLVGLYYGNITNAYWDSYSTGRLNGSGYNLSSGLTAITSDPTKSEDGNYAFNPAAYSGFDFTNTWFMADGTRPFLRSEWSTTITNAHQLQLMEMDLGASYTLANDIDASETGNFATNHSGMWNASGFSPLGRMGNPFTGTLSGGGHVINDLTIARSSQNYVGLFGWNGGIIDDVGLQDSNVSGSYFVGGLAGFNTGAISNTYATGVVSGADSVGGLVGVNPGTISTSYATTAVSGWSSIGGLVGYNDYNGTISNAYATGVVSGVDKVGGLVGWNYAGGMVNNAYATGVVSGSSNVGGLVGYNPGTISNAFWDSYTTGQVNGVGNGSVAGVAAVTSDPSQSAAANYAFKSSAYSGFDFDTIWAPASAGYHPEIYGVSGVVGIKFAGDYSRTYGDSNPDFGGLSYSILGTGYWNTLTSDPAIATSADATSNVGSYDISGIGASATRTQGGAARIVYIPSTLTVTARPITVSADNLSRMYGDANPQLTYNIIAGNLVNGDSLDGELSSLAGLSAAIGTYDITQGTLASANYQIGLVNGALTVTARPITVSADNLSRAYGDANPQLTYNIIAGNLVNGDRLSGELSSLADLSAAIGTYDITQGTLAASANYQLSFVNGTLTVTVRPITVTADGLGRSYEDANRDMICPIGDACLAHDDHLTGTMYTAVTINAATGAHRATQGSLLDLLTILPDTLTAPGSSLRLKPWQSPQYGPAARNSGMPSMKAPTKMSWSDVR